MAEREQRVYVVIYQAEGCDLCNPEAGVVGVFTSREAAQDAERKWKSPTTHYCFTHIESHKIQE